MDQDLRALSTTHYIFLMFISVIIPTHNRSGKVHRAVDSVLRQSFSDFELIIVDDASTDDTRQWLNGFQDKRLRYLAIPHSGVAFARNAGVQISKGEWICFLDSDDVWRKHKLSEQIRFHAENPECVISQTEDTWIRNSVRVNKMNKNKTREGDIFKESLELCLISCSSVMIRRDIFEELNGFDEDLPTCEDYDLWLKITSKYPIGFVNKNLVTKFGGHNDQLSKKYEAMDRYRMQSLENLLQTKLLNNEQQQWAQNALETKRNIVLSGAQKRQNR